LAKSSFSNARGFSLIETLVATTIMTVALSSLAQLFLISTKANQSARITTGASVLAQQKMEQLRGLTWGFDTIGLPLSDTTSDLTVVPEQPTGGTGLTPSPDRTLRRNVDGYCDFLDERGTPVGSGTNPPPGTVYIRRWSVEPLPTNPNNTLILQVLVTRWRSRGVADTEEANAGRRLPDEARIISVKTRKAS
jgi:prepilin-type N-terminal cleavage/methylation domain-containing protein